MTFGFFLREALRSMQRNAIPSFAAMASVLVTVLVLGVFIPVVQATTGAANEVRSRVLVDVYLKTNATDADVERVRRTLHRGHRARMQERRVRLQGRRLPSRSASATPRPTSLLGLQPAARHLPGHARQPDNINKLRDALSPPDRRPAGAP